MQKGDIVIAEHPESKPSRLLRLYGRVHKVTKNGTVSIEMADGSVIKRQINSVAVYTQPPSNWEELYQQQIIHFRPKQQRLFRGKRRVSD